jgi:uncharacterized protein (TIGR00159 family)
MKPFIAFLASIRWQDIVDIIVNSYILFRLYVLFHGTNAFRILVGIASLWIVQEMAASLGLILTSWVLQGITAAAAIIIIVVFRNEIRTALQLQNLRSFLWGAPHSDRTTPIDTITESVYQMGKKRIGALIVFPGKEDLSEIIHGGIRWDGMVSQEMIMSIFWPKNPVHDGAVIIQDERIVEVGVLLPLSQRQDLPTFYGTRHRAAAGLAERTDALVIVVSEERGRVSVAKDNWIKPIVQPEEMAQILKAHLNISESKIKIKERKRERMRLAFAAILSLAIVTGLWFGFTRNRDTIITFSVPLEYRGRPSNLEILDTSVNQVYLQLSGPSALLKSLRPENVEVRLDLGKAVEGENTYPLTNDNINLPPGVFLNKIEPSLVEVTLDAPTMKELPVQVNWAGKLPDDLIVKDVKVTPEAVQVIGGSKILDKISTIYTAPVRIDGIDKSGSISTPLLLSPPSLKLAPGSRDRVVVEYTIGEKTGSAK